MRSAVSRRSAAKRTDWPRRQSLDVRVPPGCRDRVLPVSDPRAQILTGVGIFMASLSEVVKGFHWRSADPVSHFVLGSLEGSGFYETAPGGRRSLRRGELVFLPAHLPRSYGTTGAKWKILTIRLADLPRWRDAARRGVQHVREDWVRRLEIPMEGMLAEAPSPMGNASDPGGGTLPGADAFDDLVSRYDSSRLARDREVKGSGDTFVLYGEALRAQLEAMLRIPRDADEDHGPFALERLWLRVRGRLDEPWTTTMLGRELGVSRPTLHRMVRRHHGIAPRAALDRLRMEEAASLLADSDHPVKVIAARLGYASAFSFSAAFKRVFRESPKAFRARVVAAHSRPKGSGGSSRPRK